MSGATVDDLQFVTDQLKVLITLLTASVYAVGGIILFEVGAPAMGWAVILGAVLLLTVQRAARYDGYCRSAWSHVPGINFTRRPLEERKLSDELTTDWEVAD